MVGSALEVSGKDEASLGAALSSSHAASHAASKFPAVICARTRSHESNEYATGTAGWRISKKLDFVLRTIWETDRRDKPRACWQKLEAQNRRNAQRLTGRDRSRTVLASPGAPRTARTLDSRAVARASASVKRSVRTQHSTAERTRAGTMRGRLKALLRLSCLCITARAARSVPSPAVHALLNRLRGGSQAATLEDTLAMSGQTDGAMAAPSRVTKPAANETLVLFSDLDGTLIHYPDIADLTACGNEVVRLPPSSTGMQGIISHRTHAMIRDLRRSGVKVVLVSGMRTTTLLSRLPYLPRADAYCSEAGGRIFLATDAPKCDFIVKPKRFDGATAADLKQFGLKEDAQWRAMMEKRAGKVDPLTVLHRSMKDSTIVSDVCERDGLLWDFARSLMEQGYVLDTKGYSTCFRVNRKQQDEMMEDSFDRLVDGSVKPWEGLETSTNLGCVDFYPKESGKLNCCKHLSTVFFPKHIDNGDGSGVANDSDDADDNDNYDYNFLASHAVCMCDDDNDLEMALACQHAYIPEVTSSSMAELVDKEKSHFTKTFGDSADQRGHYATEHALSMILERVRTDRRNEAGQ